MIISISTEIPRFQKMVEFVTILYLAFMFIALYFFSFFIILTFRNRDKIFTYSKPNIKFSKTILIPAYNEQESIKETIDHIMALNYPKKNLEVIVINDGSTDNTAELVKNLIKKYPNLKLIDKKNSGKADSLNQGVKKAKGELIAIVDSDSFPSPESLKKLSGFFDNPKMGAVTSFVRVRNKNYSLFSKIQSIEYLLMGWSRKLLDFVDSVYVTNGPLSLYRKSYVLKVGGFDPNSVTEDIDITWNMLNHNYKTSMCLDADVSTIVPTKFKKWFRQRTRWGLGGLQAIQKYKSMFLKKGMFGAFILPYVSFSIILSLAIFLFSTYLILKNVLRRLLTITYSISTQSTVFSLQDINLYPSIIIFYFIILFTLSLSYSWYILKTTEFEEKLGIKKFFNILFYILIYLTLYPLVWFASIYRFIMKDVKW